MPESKGCVDLRRVTLPKARRWKNCFSSSALVGVAHRMETFSRGGVMQVRESNGFLELTRGGPEAT